MARKQSSVLEDLFVIAAALPWWVGVALAITSYLFFYSVAVTEIAPTTQVGQMGGMVIKNLFKTFSTVLQYILPLIFLLVLWLHLLNENSERNWHLKLGSS